MRLTRYLGDSEAISPRYSPGYCGMNLSVQQALFKLVEAESLGVCLLPSMLMQPLKSVSGLLGLGDRRSFGRVDAPCERCNDAHCSTRR